MRRLVVHCGLPKTGSSSLQRFLFKYRRHLSLRKWEYPDLKPGVRIAHHDIALDILRNPNPAGQSEEVRNLVAKICNDPAGASYILSSEAFTNCIAAPNATDSFLEFLRGFRGAGIDVSAVMVFRPIYQFVESSFLQSLRAGNLRSGLEEYLESRKDWIVKFLAGLERVRAELGDGNLVFIRLESGTDTARDFARLIGCEDLYESRIQKQRAGQRLNLWDASRLYFHLLNELLAAGKTVQATVQHNGQQPVAMDAGNPEIYNYRIVSPLWANLLQETARTAVSPRLAESIGGMMEPAGDFEFVDLNRPFSNMA